MHENHASNREKNLRTVDLQWLVYHGCFEFVFESQIKNLNAADIIVFGLISGVFCFNDKLIRINK